MNSSHSSFKGRPAWDFPWVPCPPLGRSFLSPGCGVELEKALEDTQLPSNRVKEPLPCHHPSSRSIGSERTSSMQTCPSDWSKPKKWWLLRCRLVGPHHENTNVLWITANLANGLWGVPYCWAGVFVLEVARFMSLNSTLA